MAGEIEQAVLETSLTIDRDLAERVEVLVPAVAGDPRARAHGRVTRASILRLALLEGVEVLERRYGVTEPDFADCDLEG